MDSANNADADVRVGVEPPTNAALVAMRDKLKAKAAKVEGSSIPAPTNAKKAEDAVTKDAKKAEDAVTKDAKKAAAVNQRLTVLENRTNDIIDIFNRYLSNAWPKNQAKKKVLTQMLSQVLSKMLSQMLSQMLTKVLSQMLPQMLSQVLAKMPPPPPKVKKKKTKL